MSNMVINTNVLALNSHRALKGVGSSIAKSSERLSSGLRINRAADDAAGLAISEKMRSQVSGLNRASKNSQDGISLIQTAEGALQETENMLQRMRELVTQASNDTNEQSDRNKIALEIDALSLEIADTADKTEFNKKKLIDGSWANKDLYLQVGANSLQKLEFGIANMDAIALGVTTKEIGNVIRGEVTASNSGVRTPVGISAVYNTAVSALNLDGGAGRFAMGTDGKVTITGTITSFDGETFAAGTYDLKSFENKTFMNPAGTTSIVFSADAKSYTTYTHVDGAVVNPATARDGDSLTAGSVTVTFGSNQNSTTADQDLYEADGTLAVKDSALRDSVMYFTKDGTQSITVAYAANASQVANNTTAAVVTDLVTANAIKSADLGLLAGNYGDAKIDSNGIITGKLVSTDGFSYDVSVTADRAGKSFVTDQGMLEFSADGNQVTIHKNVNSENYVKDTLAAITIGSEISTGAGSFTILNGKVDNFTAGRFVDENGEIFMAAGSADLKNKSIRATDGFTYTFNEDGIATREKTTPTGEKSKSVQDPIAKAAAEKFSSDVAKLKQEDPNVSLGKIISLVTDKIDAAIEVVSSQRAKLGAYQNRLEHTIANLDVSAENLTASESRVRDTDMAAEMMNLTKKNVLSQAATSMLAQANQAPQSVLQLLQ